MTLFPASISAIDEHFDWVPIGVRVDPPKSAGLCTRNETARSSLSLPPSSARLPQAEPNASIGAYDQVTQSLNIQSLAGAQLHMTHALARAFEQAGGIR